MFDRSISDVLVVDDEPIISRTLAEILRREGFDASYSTNPVEALEQVRATPPDLLITDVMMPQLSGVALAMEVSQQYPCCRILLFSGQAGTLDLLGPAREQGFSFPLLLKPIHPKQLLAEIRKLITGQD